MSSVPVIDFTAFGNGTKQERAELANRITQELTKYGAMRLINHGVTVEMIKECYAWSDKFFRLPAAEKSAIPNERNANPQRGWSYVGSEKTSKLNKVEESGQFTIAEDELVPQDLEDAKEHFDFGGAHDIEFPSKWPNEASIPGFRKFMETFLLACQDVARDIVTALEIGLGLPVGAFTRCMETRVDELRLNYYSPLAIEMLNGGKYKRAWPHTDFGLITVLFQDAAGGLEVENREKPGGWIPISCESPTEMGVYVSDTLEHLTNGYLRAGVHQVVSPISMKDRETGVLPERYTMAFFAKADRQANVGPLEKYIVSADNHRYFQDLTAIALHKKRVAQLYGTVPV